MRFIAAYISIEWLVITTQIEQEKYKKQRVSVYFYSRHWFLLDLFMLIENGLEIFCIRLAG